jgi:hypothetical protein
MESLTCLFNLAIPAALVTLLSVVVLYFIGFKGKIWKLALATFVLSMLLGMALTLMGFVSPCDRYTQGKTNCKDGRRKVVTGQDQRIARLAAKEAGIWKTNGWTENTSKGQKRIAEYFRAAGYDPPAAETASKNGTFWSAAFISWVMKTADVTPVKGFKLSARHSDYIRQGLTDADVYTLTPDNCPQLADVICNPRASSIFWDTDRNYPGHGDIVISRGFDTVTVVGGNLGKLGVVKSKTYTINSDGTLSGIKPTGASYPVHAIVRSRAGRTLVRV